MSAPTIPLPAPSVSGSSNVFGTKWASPDQYPGATDDIKMAAVINALLPTGGTIVLQAGKSYVWANPIGPFDFATNGNPIYIIAFGATITCNFAGYSAVFKQTATATTIRTLTVYGGFWKNSLGDFFQLQDVNNAVFRGCRYLTPVGTLVELCNINFWCERNSFEDIDDNGSQEAVRFVIRGATGGAGHQSFARTRIVRLKLQGGVSGVAKINPVNVGADNTFMPSLYDGHFEDITGNIADGVIVQKIAGNMNGAMMFDYHVEAPGGSSTAAYFIVGTGIEAPTGIAPTWAGQLPAASAHNMLLFGGTVPVQLPFVQSWFANGLSLTGAAVHNRLSNNIGAGGGAAAFNTSRCNSCVVFLAGNCTGTTLNNTTQIPDGVPDTSQGQFLDLAYQQDAVGGHTYVWPTTCRFVGAAPNDTTASTITSVHFMWDPGFNKWREVSRAVAVPTV